MSMNSIATIPTNAFSRLGSLTTLYVVCIHSPLSNEHQGFVVELNYFDRGIFILDTLVPH